MDFVSLKAIAVAACFPVNYIVVSVLEDSHHALLYGSL